MSVDKSFEQKLAIVLAETREEQQAQAAAKEQAQQEMERRKEIAASLQATLASAMRAEAVAAAGALAAAQLRPRNTPDEVWERPYRRVEVNDGNGIRVTHERQTPFLRPVELTDMEWLLSFDYRKSSRTSSYGGKEPGSRTEIIEVNRGYLMNGTGVLASFGWRGHQTLPVADQELAPAGMIDIANTVVEEQNLFTFWQDALTKFVALELTGQSGTIITRDKAEVPRPGATDSDYRPPPRFWLPPLAS